MRHSIDIVLLVNIWTLRDVYLSVYMYVVLKFVIITAIFVDSIVVYGYISCRRGYHKQYCNIFVLKY
jgi:hypothetical protein